MAREEGEARGQARDDARMTFIVIPHGKGDLSTRSFEISYRRLRMAAVGGAIVVVLVFLMAASWIWVAAQAARVPSLQREVAALQGERQERERLARTVARMQATYEQIRVMLRGELPPLDSALVAPAQRSVRDSTAGRAPAGAPTDTAFTDSTQAALPRAWPLGALGFVTRGPVALPGGHPGLDIAVAAGSQILASGAGTVLEAGEDRVYGRYVRIGHAGGYESVYGHASALLVHAHQHVRRAQVIALSGSTGRSTAPHLHFEIRKDGRAVDPRLLVSNP